MIAMHLNKEQPLDADQRGIQQINFTANLEMKETSKKVKEVKETVLDFSQEKMRII